MDIETLQHYAEHASELIDAYDTCLPARLYTLIETFFRREGRTLDVGCGSGRDIAYLEGAGFGADGVDANPGFVEHCKARHPSSTIYHDSLPELNVFEGEGHYDNLLVCAVLMHLDGAALIEAIANLLRVTKRGGRIVVAIRKGTDPHPESHRQADGRLYTPIPSGQLISLFESFGGKLLLSEAHQDDTTEGGR